MPRYGIHGIVLSKAAQKLASGSGSDAQAGKIINDNLSYAMLGAVGPDIFFWAEDFQIASSLSTLFENID
jgi:hypothetical protein